MPIIKLMYTTEYIKGLLVFFYMFSEADSLVYNVNGIFV